LLNEDEVYIVVGSRILSSSSLSNMLEMVVAYLGTFYLLISIIQHTMSLDCLFFIT